MKRIILLLIIMLSVAACETSNRVQEDIDLLKQKRIELREENQKLNNSIDNKQNQIESFKDQIKELGHLSSGEQPRYIIKVQLKQSHFSLDLSKHIKDAINSIEFEIPVDKQYYDQLHVGSKIVDEFRTGSLIMRGSFGEWRMKVINKRIE